MNSRLTIYLAASVILLGCDSSRPDLQLAPVAPIVRDAKLTEPVGIETLGGVFTRLLEPGQQLPASTSEVFSTGADNQDQIKISVYRGVRELAKDNMHVGTFQIYGIAPAKRGAPQIEVTFKVSRHGDISVKATDLSTGASASIRRM